MNELVFLLLLLNYVSANHPAKPPRSTMIMTEDFRTTLVGTYISQASWTAGRQPPTIEPCAVACATKCARTTCNAIMYVRATKECHVGEGVTLPKSAEEPREFVYMIEDTAGAGTERVSAYFNVTFQPKYNKV